MVERMPDTKGQVLLVRLGGEAVLHTIVENVYLRVVADKSLEPFFEGVSLEDLKKHQQEFLKMVFTKPSSLNAINMVLVKKHSRLFDMGLGESHFDFFCQHFMATLQELQVKNKIVREALDVIDGLRPAFVEGAQQAKERIRHVQKPKLTDLLANQLNNEHMADVMLQGNDGGRIPACRFLLGVRSRVFARMLFGSFKESSEQVIHMDFETDVLQGVVEYCYTDEIKSLSRMLRDDVENGARIAVHLARAAHFLEMDGLTREAHEMACLFMQKMPQLAEAVLEDPLISPDLVHEAQDVVAKQLLLNRLGGTPVLEAAIEEFYTRTLMDESLERFFFNVDIQKLRRHQVKFMTLAFSSEVPLTEMADAIFAHHYRLFEMGLDESHFDAVMGHFCASLEAVKVPKQIVVEACSMFNPLRTVFENGQDRV